MFSDLTPFGVAEEYQRLIVHFWCVYHHCRWPRRQSPRYIGLPVPVCTVPLGKLSLQSPNGAFLLPEYGDTVTETSLSVSFQARTVEKVQSEWLRKYLHLRGRKWKDWESCTTRSWAICNINRCHGMGMILTGEGLKETASLEDLGTGGKITLQRRVRRVSMGFI